MAEIHFFRSRPTAAQFVPAQTIRVPNCQRSAAIPKTPGVFRVSQVKSSSFRQFSPLCLFKFARLAILATVAMLVVCAGPAMRAQNMTLEGQTGGFITPTAYVVTSEPGHVFSHPVVGFHFVAAGNVIGDVYSMSFTEGVANHFEFGYTRSLHTNGNNPYYSPLWFYNGFNVVHGKFPLIPETFKGHAWVPAVAVGGVYRNQVRYVSGAIAQKAYNNGDVYIVATRTLRMTKPPILLNFGFKGSNASIYGIG